MRNPKKPIAFFLSLVMILTAIPAFSMPAYADTLHTIEAHTYAAGGTVLISTPHAGTNAAEGDLVEIQCTPPAGYRLVSVLFGRENTTSGAIEYGTEFAKVGGKASVQMTSATLGQFTMPDHDVALFANFVPDNAQRHTVTINITDGSDHGALAFADGTTTKSFYEGELVQVFPTLEDGYGIAYTGSYSTDLQEHGYVKMPATDLTVPARVAPTIDVHYSVNIPGRGEATGSAIFISGKAYKITAAPSEGYSFVNWTAAGKFFKNTAIAYITPHADSTGASLYLKANFRNNSKKLVQVSAYDSNSGTIAVTGGDEVMTGGYEFEPGSNCNISFTTNPGFTFFEWAENGSRVTDQPSYDFSVSSDRTFVAATTAIFSGIGTESNPFVIDSASGLRYLAQLVNSGNDFAGEYLVLASDIDLGAVAEDGKGIPGMEFAPIGDETHPFNGHLKSQNAQNEINNIYLKASGNNLYAGLFGYIGPQGEIKGVKVSGAVEIESTGEFCYAGALAGCCEGKIIESEFAGNIDITNSATACYLGGCIGRLSGADSLMNNYKSIYYTPDYANGVGKLHLTVENNGSGSIYAGGIAGQNDGGLIEETFLPFSDIFVNNTSSDATCYAGGITGQNRGHLNYCISHCTDVYVTNAGGDCYAGGITGDNAAGADLYDTNGGITVRPGDPFVKHALSNGPVLVKSADNAYVGGIAGTNSSTISYYINTGAVGAESCNNAVAGGVAGENMPGGQLQDSYNLGVVNTLHVPSSVVGGVAAKNDENAKIEGCYSNGIFRNRDTGPVGGVTGINDGTIEKSYSMGLIEGPGESAGLAVVNNGTIRDCYNIAYIEGNGLVGQNNGAVSKCYSYGEVTGYAGANGGIVQNCYYLEDSAADGAGTGEMTALSDSDFLDPQSFAGWNISDTPNKSPIDFNETWQIFTGDLLNRPMLTRFRERSDGEFRYHGFDGMSFSSYIASDGFDWVLALALNLDSFAKYTSRFEKFSHFFTGDEGQPYTNILCGLKDYKKHALYGAYSSACPRVDGTISGLDSAINAVFLVGLDENALRGASNLHELEISSEVQFVGDYALAECPNLSEIRTYENNPIFYSPDGALRTKDDREFIVWPAAKAQTSYTLPIGTEIIRSGAFDSASGLENLTLQNRVKAVGDYVFRDATSLKSIKVASGNANYCDVDGVLFTKDLKTLVAYPADREGSSYTVPAGVTTIAAGAFDSAQNLETLNVPASVTKIGDLAFRNTKILHEINVAAGNAHYRSVDGVLYSADGTTLISFPPGRVGEYVIPSGVTTIEDAAFYNCTRLTSVVLPSTVTDQEKMAGPASQPPYGTFNGCGQLRTVCIYNDSGILSAGTFTYQNCHQDLEFKVPAVELANYQGDSIYNQFAISANTPIEHTVTMSGGAITAVNNITNGGITSGSCLGGTLLAIKADAAPAGKIFAGWQSFPGSVFFAAVGDKETTFLMPETDVTVEATYGDKISRPRSRSYSYQELASPMRFLGGHLDIKTAGGLVTMKAVADEHYSLSGLTVQEAGSGKAVALTTLDSGLYSFTFPRENVTIRATFKPDLDAIFAPFADLKKALWYAEPVAYAVSHDIMRGTGEGFEPSGAATRAQVSQILFNLDASPIMSTPAAMSGIASIRLPLPGAAAEPKSMLIADSNAKTGNLASSRGLNSTKMPLLAAAAEPKSMLIAGSNANTSSPASALGSNSTKMPLLAAAAEAATINNTKFADVKAGDWYAAAVTWMAASGIARGEGDSFGVNSPITREQLAVFLYNYAKLKGLNLYAAAAGAADASNAGAGSGAAAGAGAVAGSTAADAADASTGNSSATAADASVLLRFSDCADTSAWSKEALAWAVQTGIISGTDKDGAILLDPRGRATRAQISTIIARFIERIVFGVY